MARYRMSVSYTHLEALAHGFQKAFVCTDPDLIKFGVASKVTDVLDKAGLAYEIYSDIKANPTIENVQHGVEAFKEAEADYIVAIGGGSSMDTAKLSLIHILQGSGRGHCTGRSYRDRLCLQFKGKSPQAVRGSIGSGRRSGRYRPQRGGDGEPVEGLYPAYFRGNGSAGQSGG